MQQVRTSLQTIGAGETCGYECIKNTCGVVSLIKGLSGHHLFTKEAAQELFGQQPEGALRHSINQSRKHHALVELIIANHIAPYTSIQRLPNESVDTIKNYLNEYRYLMRKFLHEQITALEKTGQTTLTTENISDYMIHAPINNIYATDKARTAQDIEKLHQARIQYLRNPENIARYIRIIKSVKLTQNDFDNAIINFNKNRQPDFQLPTNGENLTPDEICQLFEQERANAKSIIGQMIKDVPIISLELPEKHEKEVMALDETLVTIHDAIEKRNTKQLKRIYIIMVRGSEQGTRNNRHLVSMVLEIAPGRSRRYIMINSENEIQLYRGPLAMCINFLEDCNIEPPSERKQQRVDTLYNCATQCFMALENLDHELLTYRTSWGSRKDLPEQLRHMIHQLLHKTKEQKQ